MRACRMVRNIRDIFSLTTRAKEELYPVEQVFPFKAPACYLSLIDWDDPNDPIRRIVIPDPEELLSDGMIDPCDEAANFAAPGVQHKYPHTTLLIVSQECAGYCRYCFRKRFFLESSRQLARDEAAAQIEPALDYIAQHKEITNVLLTGGDPLILPTEQLAYILGELREMHHIGVIRIGTRMPVFYPQRITGDPGLLRALKRVTTSERRVYIVTHFDHPREITDESLAAIALLINNGLLVLNQHPILTGVNDDPDVLVKLYRELTSAGVATYYTFLVRPTQGNSTFQIPIVRAYEILAAAKRRLSGIDKRLRLVLSHATGKIHVLGVDRDVIYMQYHRARDPENEGQILLFARDDRALWLDELEPVELVAR